jgi:hypothetical protein
MIIQTLMRFCDHTNEKDVLKAIDSVLANLDFIDVFIREKFYQESLADVTAIRELPMDLQKKSLQQIWEEKLCTRYNCSRISLSLHTGSLYGEYHTPLSTLIPFAFSQISGQASHDFAITKLKVTLPPSLALPLSKSLSTPLDQGLLNAVVKSASTIDLSNRNALRACLIDEFGIPRDIADRILPNCCNVSPWQHVECYINGGQFYFLSVDEFAATMRLRPDADVSVQMRVLFTLRQCDDSAAWFVDHISCFTHIQGGWENGKKFMTVGQVEVHPGCFLVIYILPYTLV